MPFETRATEVRSSFALEMWESWRLLFPAQPPPEKGQFALWHLQHGSESLRKAMVQLAMKHKSLGGAMNALWMARFLTSVLTRLSQQNARKDDRLKLASESNTKLVRKPYMSMTQIHRIEAGLDALLVRIETGHKPTFEEAREFADLLFTFAETDITALMGWLKRTVTMSDEEQKVRHFLAAIPADEATHAQARQFLTENTPKVQ